MPVDCNLYWLKQYCHMIIKVQPSPDWNTTFANKTALCTIQTHIESQCATWIQIFFWHHNYGLDSDFSDADTPVPSFSAQLIWFMKFCLNSYISTFWLATAVICQVSDMMVCSWSLAIDHLKIHLQSATISWNPYFSHHFGFHVQGKTHGNSWSSKGNLPLDFPHFFPTFLQVPNGCSRSPWRPWRPGASWRSGATRSWGTSCAAGAGPGSSWSCSRGLGWTNWMGILDGEKGICFFGCVFFLVARTWYNDVDLMMHNEDIYTVYSVLSECFCSF